MIEEQRVCAAKFAKQLASVVKCNQYSTLPNLLAATAMQYNLAPRYSGIVTSLHKRVSSECAQAIVRHLRTFQVLYSTLMTQSKFRSFVVGLMFLMRKGVFIYDIQLLPCVRNLVHIIPRELYVKKYFGVSGKALTETENVIKMGMRSISSDHVILRNACVLTEM